MFFSVNSGNGLWRCRWRLLKETAYGPSVCLIGRIKSEFFYWGYHDEG